MIKWNDFEVIVKIKENRTLSAAALRLGLNQSTVSRILKRIEIQLDISLFSNSSGIYELTPEGEVYFRIGKEMEKAVSSIDKSELPAKVRGTVRITTVEALVGYLVSRIVTFSREFPDISIELNGSNEKANLPRREFHGAIRLHREEKSKSLISKKLGEIGISGYQKHSGDSFSKWIGYESSLSSIPEEKWLRSHTKSNKQHLHVSSYVTMEKAIASGLGMGLLPRFMGEHNPELKLVTGGKPLIMRPVWFLSHSDFRQNPAMRIFSAWLFKQFEADRIFLAGLTARG